LADLLSVRTRGGSPPRVGVVVDLDGLAGVRGDAAGGWLDLRDGTSWSQELLDEGDPDAVPDPDADPGSGLWIEPEGSRHAWQDMADFIDTVETPAARIDLAAAIDGRGGFRRFQAALNQHEQDRAAWRVFSSERRTGRARAWLADAGYDALP